MHIKTFDKSNETFTPKNFSMYLMLILPTLKCNSPYIKLLHIENFPPFAFSLEVIEGLGYSYSMNDGGFFLGK